MNCRPSQPRSITASDLKNILTEEEGLRVEFKLEFDVSPGQGAERKRGEFAKDIMALANAAGRHADDFAYLVIGAGDKLQADGTRPRKSIEPGQYSGKSLLAIVNGACAPELKELIVTEVHLDGTLYGVVTLPPSPHVQRQL